MNTVLLFQRALSDQWRLGKKFYQLFFFQQLAVRSIPFLGFIYMTRIVDALTKDDMTSIPSFILQYLIILLILQVVNGILTPLVDNHNSLLTTAIFAEPNKKMVSMHYHYAESSKVREQLDHINRQMMSGQSSLAMIQMRLQPIISALITIIWGLVLILPLFKIDYALLANGLWWLNPFIIVALFILLVMAMVKNQLKQSEDSAKKLNEMLVDLKETNARFHYEDSILQDVQSGKEIRLYNLTDKMVEQKQAENQFTRKMLEENYGQFIKSMLPSNGLFQIMNYIIYAYVGLLVLLGILPVALIIQLSNALSQIVSELPQGIQQFMMMISDPEHLKEYYAFMDLPDEEMVGSLPVEKRLDNDYQLSVNNLSFAYPDTTEQVLKNIDENFEAGKKYAIVGENGSGKTTFIKLLTRLYEPTEGEIQLNHIDARKYDLREYFNLFGVVFQDFRLLGFNIGQNVSVEPSFNGNQVKEKLDDVDLGGFIKELPKQLKTYLGTEFNDSGVNLSGGQEQKIALARALYKDAPVMILDEPTAALDPLTEYEIYQKFDQIVQDKTVFYISHRLSSTKLCDEVLVFDQGKIVQRGSHEELVDQPGKYQDLWTAQAQYYQ